MSSKKFSSSHSLGQTFGRIERETGKVYLVSQNFRQKDLIENTKSIQNSANIETDETGEAILTLDNGYRIRIFEDSSINIEALDRVATITLKKGSMIVENFGQPSELIIAKDGKRFSAAEYNGLDTRRAEYKEKSEVKIEPIVETTRGLSEEEISAVISNNKNYLFKCYTQLLQKQPEAKGEVSLNFTIENSGKVSSCEASSKQIKDETFFRCLKEVMLRIEFMSFKGPGISTLFPIVFE